MSDWNAPLCGACWNAERPESPMDPARDGLGEMERCSSCGMVTFSGIYVRRDPQEQTYSRSRGLPSVRIRQAIYTPRKVYARYPKTSGQTLGLAYVCPMPARRAVKKEAGNE